MQQSRDRGDEVAHVDAAFADPAFASLKARGAPFVVLRMGSGGASAGRAGPGEVVWANAAAARFWGADTPARLAAALFGDDGRDGWLADLMRGLVPGRPPRLARAGLARGLRMRADTALVRAWVDRDGTTSVGLAVSDADAPAGTDGGGWRLPAWEPDAAPDDRRRASLPDDATPADATPDDATPDAGGGEGDGGGASGASHGAEDGSALAQRSRLAVLRDRLSRALDGAAAVRMVWRTDAAGAVIAADPSVFARLGSPLRLEGSVLPDAVARCDPDGAERLRAALAARATFALATFDLPVADAAATVPLALSGSPVFRSGRDFAGFRGFGVVDLGRLALAEPQAPPRTERRPAATTDAATTDAATIKAGTAGEAEAGAAEAGGAAPNPPDAAPEPPVPIADAPAADAPERHGRPANVVHLRAFQGGAPGRFGAVPPAAPAPADEAAREPAPPEDGPHEDGPHDGRLDEDGPHGDGPASGAGEDGILSDQLAFLALGEALRARIGGGPHAAEPADAAAPPRPEQAPAPGPAVEPASALLDQLPVPVLATVDGRPVFANAAAAARLGYPGADALVAAGAGAIVRPAGGGWIEARDALGATMTVAARSVEASWAGRPTTLWLLAEQGGGAAAPVEARAAPADGDRSVELLDRVDDAVALLDAAGRLRRLNLRGEAWFGRCDPALPPSRGLAELLVPESRPVALALLGEVRGGRDGVGAPPLKREVVARTVDGAALPMLLTAGRLGASGFYATLRDVSALQRAEIDRAHTERDRARAAGRLPDLLAKVSHEIRTPLGAILGFAEVMMDERFGPLGNPRYKDYLKDIHASGAQVVALVEDLLDLSRIEAGQLDLDVVAVDINRVVTEAVAQMQPEAHRERVIMRTSLAGRIPSALVDERSARQIVKNLLSNAVRFNEPGGQVIVSTAPGENESVLLRVRDTGVGMSEEAVAAALEPFGGLSTRPPAAGEARGAGGTGNGLGLPLTRALVGANGASMTVRSRPREGTLVEVSFAAAAEGTGARRPA